MLSKKLILTLLAASPAVVNAVLPIHIKDSRFIRPASVDNDPSENTVFFIKGIDYLPGGASGYDASSGKDALTDPEICARDAYAFQQLGINTVRIYSLNPDLNHDKCMTIWNNAGIYVMLDVNAGGYGESLNRADPSGTYNSVYLTRVFKFIDAFKNYPNVLGFFAGNEIINDEKNYATLDPPYIRAVQRDMKQYIKKHANRTIPVGYSAADNTELRLATFDYLQCNVLNGTGVSSILEESRSDFYGLNTYSWCSGTSTWSTSGYDVLNSTFSDTVIPLLFSEYGCNKNSPRTFDEVSEGLYDGLIDVFSGGLVYEFNEEANNYGLVAIDDSTGELTYKDDFVNLQKQFNSVEIPTIYEKDLDAATSTYKCDAAVITSIYESFGVSGFSIPTQPGEISSLIENGVNGNNTGIILTDYSPPTTFSYTIRDTDSSVISTAKITYDSTNMLNAVKVLTTSSASSATSASSSSSHSSSTSTVSSSSSSSSSSKGDANLNSHATTGLFLILSAFLTAFL
ncbi:hypothetical protein TPHA_0G00620 [Tetrapisispora phaffii CBS 4417]|uniref:1,3-beta-glucanosyltransferase n=1 Tax=Tetrapisispora phaffii (strain ATCC 24235 / CBS 4417 / NBRC 1672 / NRRL Y-8282 / UCD 70-5) TaxID=1071381 RepID=G8BVH0_TETPH|nr:hypothetical protein TPHA_0G00620 [Tetrapisispora phaffii CBS 4417]CCE63898.1 hypothetical protein TPHA_0G00620 [Tetrapisispora phaffii CBS 4417]